MGAEFLQRFQFAAEQSGVSAEGFDKSMKFFSKTMGESTMGLGLGLDAIQQLGVSLQDTAGNTKKIDVLFLEMMLALDGVTNSTERAGLATKLLVEQVYQWLICSVKDTKACWTLRQLLLVF